MDVKVWARRCFYLCLLGAVVATVITIMAAFTGSYIMVAIDFALFIANVGMAMVNYRIWKRS